MIDLQTAIERGDVVDFRAICRTMGDRELFLLWCNSKVQRQPTLAAAANKLLIERGVIR